MKYVGIDRHRQFSHMTMMEQAAQVLRSGRIPNLRTEIEKSLGLELRIDPSLYTKRIRRPWARVKSSRSGSPRPRRADDWADQPGMRPNEAIPPGPC